MKDIVKFNQVKTELSTSEIYLFCWIAMWLLCTKCKPKK